MNDHEQCSLFCTINHLVMCFKSTYNSISGKKERPKALKGNNQCYERVDAKSSFQENNH
ncbi:hypothetical protein NC651_011023 [Populus alba x Populus x berolinensis]|nr:hypothetical protein NC651_011023 [Populus alba x Populus x berolinensis]